MIIKRLIAAMLAAGMMLSVSAHAKTIEITIGESNAYISDTSIESKLLDAQAYIENSRTMVPLRFIAESFDTVPDWNETQKKVTLNAGDSFIELTIGSTTAYINGEEKQLDTAPVIVNNRTMLPLRFVAEAMGKSVEYIDASNQILISDTSPVLEINDDIKYFVEDYKYIAAINGVPFTAESLTYMIPYITSYLTEVGAIASDAKKAQNPLTDNNEETANAIVSQISSTKESVYSVTLMATAVKHAITENLAYNHLTNQSTVADTEQIDSIYNTEYVCAKHILVPTVDIETNTPLSDDEKKEAKKKAEEALSKAKKGEDFDKLISEYNSDPGMEYNPNGYVFTKKQMVAEFEEAAYALKEGDISDIVETTYGYHIIQRQELPEMSADVEQAINSSITASKMNDIIAKTIEKSTIKQNITDAEIASCMIGK